MRYNAVLGGGVLANKSTQNRLRDYAKMGAALRASELQAEINEIYRAFPELKLKKKSASGGASNGASRAAEAPAKGRAPGFPGAHLVAGAGFEPATFGL